MTSYPFSEIEPQVRSLLLSQPVTKPQAELVELVLNEIASVDPGAPIYPEDPNKKMRILVLTPLLRRGVEHAYVQICRDAGVTRENSGFLVRIECMRFEPSEDLFDEVDHVYWVQPSCWNKDRLTEALELFVQSKFKAVCSWYDFKTEFGDKLRLIVDNLKQKVTGKVCDEPLKFVVEEDSKYKQVEDFTGQYQEPSYQDMSEEQQKQVHRQVKEWLADWGKQCTVDEESKGNA